MFPGLSTFIKHGKEIMFPDLSGFGKLGKFVNWCKNINPILLFHRFTQVNFFIHNVAQIRHAPQMKDDDSASDAAMPVLSFSPHTYSTATDDKIISARVVDYQKRYTPEKYYVYLINVCRENKERPTFVFRRYSHFHEFNAKLTDLFPHQNLPKLPGTD